MLKMNKEVKPKSNNDKDVNIIKHLDKIDNDKGSKNKLTESVNVYTAFATKLKMNKKLNFSKKETANEEEIAKLNSGTNLVNKTSIKLILCLSKLFVKCRTSIAAQISPLGVEYSFIKSFSHNKV